MDLTLFLLCHEWTNSIEGVSTEREGKGNRKRFRIINFPIHNIINNIIQYISKSL